MAASPNRPMRAAFLEDRYSRQEPTGKTEIKMEATVEVYAQVVDGIKAAIGRDVVIPLTRAQLQELIDFYDRCEERWPTS